jgi:hypothetical protein
MPPSRNRHSAQRVFTWDKIKMALAAAEEGFYIWNIKTGVIHYTDRCLTMMGASRKEKAPNIFTQPELTIHEEDQAFFSQEVRRYLDGHSHMPMRIEIRMKKLNSKSWSWVRINGLARRDKQRRPVMLVGVWVEDRKIASIGVGVKKWIAMHGFAFNVTRESLPPFQAITPCGIQGVQMTCLEQEMPESGQKDDLLDRFGDAFATLWKEKFHRNSEGAECAGEHEKSFFP